MIELIHEMSKNYIKITPDEGENQEDYGMKMVENNSIEGLLSLKSVSINNKTSYLYEISGRISLKEKYAVQEFSSQDIGYIMAFIKNMLTVMKSYMLDFDGLLLEPEYIFCSIGTGDWGIAYNNIIAKEARKELRRLFEFILNRLDHKDQKAVVVGYGLYKRVCQEEIVLEQLFDSAEEMFGEEKKEEQAEYELRERVIPDVMPIEVSEEREAEIKGIFGWNPDKRKLLLAGAAGLLGAVVAALFWVFPSMTAVRFGEKGVGGLAAGIIVCLVFLLLTAGCVFLYGKNSEGFAKIESRQIPVPYTVQTPSIFSKKEVCEEQEQRTMLIAGGEYAMLRRVLKKGEEQAAEEYVLRDNPLCLGSGSQADVVLEYEGISRIHARISREGEMLFIKDMNSTNGTWVNNKRLTIYELCPLREGDIIRLAGTSFEFIDTICQ